MRTNEKIKKTTQIINRNKLRLSKEKEQLRKLDVHRKIQLGGLVIKARMQNENKSVLLGALIHAMDEIKNNEDMRNFYKIKGDAAFLNNI